MNVQALHQFVATVPGSLGEHIARRLAVDMTEAGRDDAGAALVDLAGLAAIPTMIEAEAPVAALRVAIQHAVLFHSAKLPGFIAANGGRAAFGDWCRLAGFTRPETLPSVVDIYRGTLGCSPAAAAAGMHWSLQFDDAAYYAARHADTDLTGVVVIHARVAAEGIAAFISGTAHQEVVPAEAPAVFEVITDKARITDAAVRNAVRLQGLRAQGGWHFIDTHGMAERVAMAARDRMAAAGVPRGASIVE